VILYQEDIMKFLIMKKTQPMFLFRQEFDIESKYNKKSADYIKKLSNRKIQTYCAYFALDNILLKNRSLSNDKLFIEYRQSYIIRNSKLEICADWYKNIRRIPPITSNDFVDFRTFFYTQMKKREVSGYGNLRDVSRIKIDCKRFSQILQAWFFQTYFERICLKASDNDVGLARYLKNICIQRYSSLIPQSGRICFLDLLDMYANEDFKGIINIFGPLGLETQVFQYLRRVPTYLAAMRNEHVDIYSSLVKDELIPYFRSTLLNDDTYIEYEVNFTKLNQFRFIYISVTQEQNKRVRKNNKRVINAGIALLNQLDAYWFSLILYFQYKK
jgi:hypothetical protein